MSAANQIDLQVLPLFQGVPAFHLSNLQQRSCCKNVAAGRCVLNEGEMGEFLYFLLKGSAKSCVENLDGREFIYNIYGPGAVFGYINALDGLEQPASIHTMETSLLLWMKRTDFVNCVRLSPELAFNLVQYNLIQTRLMTIKLHAMATYDVNGRIARQLLIFAQQYGRPCQSGDTIIPLRLTQHDLADMVGASRASVNKVIGRFKSSRIISIDCEHYFRIHCLDTLHKRCR